MISMKLFSALKIYWGYFNLALAEIYLYYVSPYPLVIILKKFSLANRKIRILLCKKRSTGRPPINQQTIDLILELKNHNPTWGAKRIRDELRKIGIFHSKATVLKYLEIFGLNSPKPKRRLSWQEFLSNHKFKIAIDFTCVISLFGNQMFIFVILDQDSRDLIFINVTYYPSAQWVAQQFKNAFLDMEIYPSLCISDNDKIFGPWFEEMLKSHFDMTLKRTPIRRPDKNGRVERFHRSLKWEAIFFTIPISISQIRRVCFEYKKYFNNFRPHQGIGGQIPGKPLRNSCEVIGFERKKHVFGSITTFEPIISLAS